MKENIVKTKSFAFSVRIVKLCEYLCEHKKVFVLSNQLLRSGTSVGAMIREAEHAETKKDFAHKMGIAQKEINETIYWLDLMNETEHMTKEQFESIHSDAIEIIKIMTAIIKSTKSNINN